MADHSLTQLLGEHSARANTHGPPNESTHAQKLLRRDSVVRLTKQMLIALP